MRYFKILTSFLIIVLFASVSFAGGYQIDHRGGSSIGTSNIDFSGSGQDDINVTGVYSGDKDRCYEVNVTATSTMKWRANCSSGDYTTGVSMTTSAVELENGIKVSWDTAAGHTATNTWKFKVKATNPFRIKNSVGESQIAVDNNDDIRFFNGQISSVNAFLGLEVQDAVGTTSVKLRREYVDVNTTTTLTNDNCGQWLMSDLANNPKVYTLPGAVAGCKIGFIVQGTALLTITEKGGDTITCGASSTGTTMTSSTADDYVELLGTGANDWVCISVGPTVADWTFN